jgi:hypothetical protein
MFVLFNKEKQFIGYSKDMPDLPTLNIFKLELPEELSDITKWKWIGDMFKGKMVPIEEKINLNT